MSTPSSTLHFTSTTTSDGIAERIFTVGDISGVLWSPESATGGAPLLLMGHGDGLHKYAPVLVSQARRAAAGDGSGDGFTAAGISRRSTPQGGYAPRVSERWSSVVADRQAMRG